MTVDTLDREIHEARRLISQFFDYANLCGCGNPERMLQQLKDGLEAHAVPGQNDHESWQRQQQWIDANYWPANSLAAWELTEHGSSIYGSWLTPDGIRLRDALRRVDLETALDDDWWDTEAELYPDGRDGSGVHQVGYWKGQR